MASLLVWTGVALILAVPMFVSLDAHIGGIVLIAGVVIMWFEFLRKR